MSSSSSSENEITSLQQTVDTSETCKKVATATSSTASSRKSAVLSKKDLRLAKEQAKHQKFLRKRAPDVVILVGLPGSGKSTFSLHLESKGGWKRISQDEMGRKACESFAGEWSKTGKVVLDRCNVETSDRKHWLDLMHNPNAQRAAAIYFDVSPEECIERVRNRENHPTIICGGTKGSENIVRGFHKRMQFPAKEEGFGQVYVVKSKEDAQNILKSWGIQLDRDLAD